MKKLKLPLLAFILCCNVALNAQQTRLIDGWTYLKGDLGGVWEAVRPFKAGDPESLPIWEKVVLPHCFNEKDAVDPDVNYYQGPGWYRNQLEIKNPYPGGRTLLNFEGAGQKTSVYIYTTLIATHVGGYDEFSVDITNAVNNFTKKEVYLKQFKGKFPVSIRCDNSRDLEMIPSCLSDFNIYGGIYRYLNLVYVPSLSLDRVYVDPTIDTLRKTGTIKVSAVVISKSDIKNGTAVLNIIDPQGKPIATTTKDIASTPVNQDLWKLDIKNPLYWSPSQPNLYTCKVTLKSDAGEQTTTEKFGFRQFEFVLHGPFKLNGKRLLLRGTHRHEDEAGVAQAMTENMMRSEMLLMKEMGVNFIRLAHYQQSRIILNLCDSLGILVWEEIPWCRGGLGNDTYKDQARRMLTNMIDQHRNHPAVIIWGLGNENDWPGDFPEYNEEKIKAFMSELNDLAHKLDPTRKTACRRSAFDKGVVDVYSPSIWAGWYRGLYTEYKETTEKEMKTVDYFFHAEWGGDSHAGRYSENPDRIEETIQTGNGTDERAGDANLHGGVSRFSKDGDWSESYICNLFDWHLKEQENMPWLTGAAFWVFKDFSTPIRPENPIPYVNQKGVLERDQTKKEAYYVFQSYWTDKPMVHIFGHSCPIRWGNEGEQKLMKIYSNCSQVELFLNGKSYGIKKRNSQDFPAAGLHWIVKFENGDNSVKVIAHKGKEEFTDEIKFQYQNEKWSPPALILFKKIKQDGDIATIQAQLVDSKGVKCLDTVNYINFSLTGDGQLIDDLGTSSGSRRVQAYNGRAIIRVKLNNGKSVAGVKSDGLKSVFLNLSNN
jgi:beta-galactosidase